MAPRPISSRFGLALVAWLATGSACMGVFLMYLQPAFLRHVADLMWSCF